MKKTKIICTLGPATNTKEKMVELINAGMNVARFNFSHGSHEEHRERFNNLKAAREETGRLNTAILLDTKGPEIRTNDMENNYVELVRGNTVRISMTEVLGNADKFSVTYSELINDVVPGNHILLDDGLVDLLVTEIDKANGEIVTEIQNTGVLKSKKGVNVPNVSVNLPGITAKDEADIRFGVQEGIDFIAASFVRRASDVMEIRAILEQEGDPKVKIISKIENQEGVDNIDEILAVSDGIMVARGDLGVEIPTHEVPIVQKYIIKKCNEAGKPVVTATQMLDSMQRNPRPTRAEAGDVANAIFDGTDAVMLSGETAAGDFPIEAVKTMAAICVRTEAALVGQDAFALKRYDQGDMTEAIGQAVGHTARNLGIETIVAATSSGHTALMISKYRPNASIVAATFDAATARRLSVSWGVEAFVINRPGSTDHMIDLATDLVQEKGYVTEGDLIIITAGVPVGEAGTTNLMKIQVIGTQLAKGEGVGQDHFIGKAIIAEDAATANEAATIGSVLVTRLTDKDFAPALEKVGAIVTEEGGITSHAAVIGLERGIPVIVSAKGALSAIENGELITVDARRGLVYRGATISI
ncbi:pyruvate kinase [Aerococcaceae bacterium zg-ZJ1578]|uniref:pyruvate kinase n=1 Tax=Aerococcaceae TaxID=186827 RepID=UPI0013BCFC7F|nr:MULTISPECIES: pyruvate kinase [unclassified Facklamia]MBK0348096.1 pyruvate kinase [Aerococcaceae bacterium zg-1578]MBR7927215.1 pyruvate kinase [Aerococcaceae bacterium zg-ZUI334]MBS4462604.1 pyruvate kinase [Aerococcaceae bacterium zg-B36]QQD66267.1 pyruvate kinase [Aerococcaceae bacterium zg-252]NEW63722.1 pyruvate kinase [Facklamia sp. 252]